MATNFPASLDSLTNPTSSDSLNSPSHSAQHANSNDAVEALQAKVGADSSAVTSSHDYKIAQLEAGVTGGKILQVVQTVKLDHFTTTSTSLVDVTGFSVSITPSSASNKVLVIANYNVSNTSGLIIGQLVRDSTEIYEGSLAVTYVGTSLMNVADGTSRISMNTTPVFLDSPATTSATTYKLQVRVNSGTGVFNRAGNAADISLASSITVMEVSA